MENESASPHGSIPEEAQRFMSELDKATNHIITDINTWLKTFHHVLYPVESIEEIEHIRTVVRRAGCQLFYEGVPVSFYFHTRARMKHITFQLKRVGKTDAKKIYSQVEFLPVLAQPYSISGNTES